ncbi:MAG: hypothetical protein R3F56_06185 [Planctomycetota bacterium]
MHRIQVAVALFVSTGLAQTLVVLPPSHAAREATSATNVPFGRSTPVRCQMGYDGVLVPRAGTVDRVAWRLDGGQTTAGKQVDMSLHASTGPRNVLTLQVTFALNVGSDDREVVARRLLSLPPLTSGQTPNPFHAQVPFDAPFAYDPRLGVLLLDATVFAQPPGDFGLDLTYVCDSPVVRYGPPGCGPQGGAPLLVDAATTQVMWGQPFHLLVSSARPGSVAGVFLGSLEQGSWGGITLPLDLTPIGASGCHLSIDTLLSAYTVADPAGTATFPFALPARPDLLGQTIRFQGIDFDPSLNALGIVTSQPGKVTVCGWERVGRVWASGTTATSGVREIGVAPPVEVRLQ